MDLLAYILHRRSPEGFLDSLSAASARDLVLARKLIVSGRKSSTSSSVEEVDPFSAMLTEGDT